MSESPYHGLPDHQFWRRAVAAVEPFRIDPVVAPRFRIAAGDAVATAGSCFAQHISRRLAGLGFNYLVTEPGTGLDEAQRRELGYGVFPARFGNLYTTRQLLQLFEECFDGRKVAEDVWRTDAGRFVDALRTQVTPGGLDSEGQVRAERRLHLAAVRRMFEQCAVFVFTLGLTEAWRSCIDGTVYPVAPGVSGGTFDPGRHEFVNFDAAQVAADLDAFLRRLKAVNPGVRVVLTVSPVPLVATYESRHVLVSNTVSKAALRVAADAAWRAHEWVDYFPSYEIITGTCNGSAYYEDDCRSISPPGVEHALRCFVASYLAGGARLSPAATGDTPDAWSDVACDEAAMDRIRG